MQCIILNKNYPPNSGVTGYSASKLAKYLVDRGVRVNVVTTDADYGGVRQDVELGSIHRIRSVYQGKNKLLRLISSIYEGYQLIDCAVKLNISPWICMTDPPLLNLWAGIKAKKLKISWAYWSMDLYPDAFCAAGLIKKSNFLYKIIRSAIKKNKPNLLIALGSRQAKYLMTEYEWSLPITLLPCGISKINEDELRPSWARGNYEILFGYAGNIGEAHCAEFLIETIRNLDYKKHRFVLSVYGTHADRVINGVKDIDGLIIVNSISQSELRYIDIHLATLLPEWDHICVPSKAVTSVCQGGALLYCGSSENDNWNLLGDCGWQIYPDGNLSTQIKHFINNLTLLDLSNKKKISAIKTFDLLNIEQRAYQDILDFILQASDQVNKV